jgi:cytidylate kinase
MISVIAIDGPAGAGKSTIARLLANKLGYSYIDTGAMYRAVTFIVLNNNISLENKNKIIELTKKLNISFTTPNKTGQSNIIVNGENIHNKIRKPIVDRHVSTVASIGEVRQEMLNMQQKMAKDGQIVMDGRDIASRVLPNADLKLYLTASVEERARRRYTDTKENQPGLTLEKVKKEICRRDNLDKSRKHSPLVKTNDALFVDTTELNIEETLNYILKIIEEGE